MADRTKFEKMLELLINEDREAAEALFHEIVVEKSRDIYESLLEDDADIEEETDEEVDESDDDEDDESDDELDESDDDDVDEGFNLDEFEVEADPMSMMGGDPTDDMIGDVDMDAGDDDMDMDMEDEGDVNDRMDDLEDALEALKAEFEAMMGGEGEEGEEEEEEEEEEGEEEEEEEEEEDEMPNKESFAPAFEAKAQKKDDKNVKKSATEEMREYVEKIGGQTYNSFGKMGDNGANTKSVVAGKNDMGGTSANITSASTEKSPVEANKGQLKGSGLLKGSPKDMSTGNVNVPGGKAGVKHLSKKSGGGLDNNSILKTDHSDKSAQSTLNKVSTRAK